MDRTVISAAMIYINLLKQLYCDAGCFLNNLTQSIYESVFQCVLRFSHKDPVNFVCLCSKRFLSIVNYASWP